MRSLALKLILAFLLVSLTGTVLVAVLAGQTTASEFGHFMFTQNQAAIVTHLADYYQAHGGWTGVESEMPLGGAGAVGGGRGAGMGGGFALADEAGRVIVAGAGYRAATQLSATELASGSPIRVGEQTVGTLLEGRGGSGLNAAGAEFLSRVNRALLFASLGATAVAILLGVLLARALTRPLREVTAATRRVAAGHLEQQVPVRSRDELGELAAAFNQMSADLKRARDLRRQMTADIAHDLRTPLSVVLGHAEALRDGVLPPTPENFNLIHDEALRLNRLVEDLRTLSLADSGELTLARFRVPPAPLLERAVAGQALRAQQQKISLQSEIAPDLPDIYVDPDRLAQALGNLLDNALRHTPAGGTVVCRLIAKHDQSRQPSAVILSISDSGPGISPDDLPRIFERLYRADKSRRRDEGHGSGLGLAIAKSIVAAHDGHIWAENHPGQGATFAIELPAVPEH
ncbi:MAG: HAMP domain-containing protein [Chloroflexi bacterium]|nr:HAMP domain-containing protein [Chloroflexota bacterium]